VKYKCGSKNRALKLICEDAIAWEESLIDALTPASYYGPATGSDAEAIEKAKLVISDAKAILRGITSNVEFTGRVAVPCNAGLGDERPGKD